MHQNYYFLRQLAPALDANMRGKQLIEAFSQEKDELILIVAIQQEETIQNPFFIKASLRSDFSCLSFPTQFDRARRNSVNLFTGLYGKTVEGVRVSENERALVIDFGADALVFKLFGNRSNCIHFDKNGAARYLFNSKLAMDAQLVFSSLDRPIDQSFEAFVSAEGNYKKLFPTFGKLVTEVLDARLKERVELPEKWKVIQHLLNELHQPAGYYITFIDQIPALSLLAVGAVKESLDDPIEALNRFYYTYVSQSNLYREKGEITRLLKKRIRQTENYLAQNFEKLRELEAGRKNEEIGNILMANLHQVPERSEKVELFDFYRDQSIIISLKKDLSPQKNAERYYRKAKNEKLEQDKLFESLDFREAELQRLQKQLEVIERIDLLKELRAYIKTEGLTKPATLESTTDLFKKIEFQGYTILVGRNARNNDLLTRQFAHKEDLWLHARDVTGSHVVIKRKAGHPFPSSVIERAAELAAWFSKRKTDSLCPVIVTPKKYVRKPKGMPEGAVVLDKESVLMVVPRGE